MYLRFGENDIKIICFCFSERKFLIIFCKSLDKWDIKVFDDYMEIKLLLLYSL